MTMTTLDARPRRTRATSARLRKPPGFACIVGAPRSGTTTLAGFLQGHPDVCFSAVKEPHFFSQHDLTGLATDELRRRVQDDYLQRYFRDRPQGRPLLAEASVSYLYAPEQMEAVLRLWPDARFIIALRDPMDMLPSLHQRLLYTGDEAIDDFGRAWSLTPDRAGGRHVPRTCIDPRWLQYEEVGRLGRYVERLFTVVGRDRCFISVFDDLVAAPADHHRRLIDFLGLAPCEQSDFAPRRAAAGYRNAWLQRLLKRPPKATRRLLAGEKFRMRVRPLDPPGPDSALVRAIFAGRKKLLAWNRAPAPPIRLSSATRRDIREKLADDVRRLSGLIDRDLSHWLGAGAPDC